MGKVYLVGAGSGDPELMTLKGKRFLERADVVLYDRLVHPLLLHLTPPQAEFIYCGKLPKSHTLRQAEINRLLVRYAQEGKQVVRLKGGDPAIFGRVAEEIHELEQHGIDYEVVPGITAASAASTYAGFSLTQRGESGRVTLATAHRQRDELLEDFAPLVQGGTLCFYMGVENLRVIGAKLQEQGVPCDMPVAILEWATWGRQRVRTGTIATIADQLEQDPFEHPAMIVVGEVIRQRKSSSWFEGLPSFGVRRLLVSRKPLTWEELTRHTSEGADVWNLQVGEERDRRFDEISVRYMKEHSFPSVIFTEEGLEEAYRAWMEEHQMDGVPSPSPREPRMV
ncbi:uroporphyrinogen-III C-methyltransferase [Gorillibacterium sp. CAU 1737]|uniref:uroporphyrinogen-III C-methyltransferase n=1 Tax=Gorillibacterium sp. CAU 1737 TaxID=3140362 RepID=UPI003261667B